MKRVVAVLAVLAAVVLALPLLAFSTPPGTVAEPVVGCGELGGVLATIRTMETGGRYDTRIATATASGAYAMIDAAWQRWSAEAGYPGQYAHAWQAPPEVQDAAAGAYVTWILDRVHGDVAWVPVYWYLPAAATNPALMDIVPMPEAGNRLTPRQYQTRWLATYHQLTATTPTCAATVDGWALPVPRTGIDAHPGVLGSPHHDYPAWDYPAPTGTPVYAIRAGTVDRVSTWAGNCYGNRAGCVELCGTGLTIVDPAGVRWIYCHATRLDVTLGQHVTAGQQLMASGNTGHSSGPHLHLGIRINGVDRCPQPLLTAIYHHQPVPTPDQLPTTGCTT